MRVELKDFQTKAVEELMNRINGMRVSYETANLKSSVCLSSPTGSGKTVISAAVIEALFFGNDELGLLSDENATVLWLSDSPSLNDQTLARFVQASDKLADWLGDRRHLEVVGNDFAASHEVLDRKHVYFMNKDLLGKGKLLTKGSEANSGRVFWDILDRTIKDPQRRLYLFIDEAHRGLGMNESKDHAQATIYSNLIDGYEGRAPMPFVIGISATPARFESAMEQRKDRTRLPKVEVSPKEVQESGLLKDTIELRVPEQDDPVEHQYLTLACERFCESIEHWDNYCVEQDERKVYPLMVIQVKDKITNEEIQSLCERVLKLVPGLDRSRSFANVFGDHKDIQCGKRIFIRYLNPEFVQEHTDIQVLFAKEAVSNGWDCPRAEVIYSQRRRSEPTYIAQLIGRMVRTPLARRIDADEMLNSVACYLPQFNPATTQKVVDYLTGKDDDMGGTAVKEVIVDPVTVKVAEPRTEEEYETEVSRYEWEVQQIEEEISAEEEPGNLFPPVVTNEGFEGDANTVATPLDEASPVASPEFTASVHPKPQSNKPASEVVPHYPAPPKPISQRDKSFTKEEWDGIRRAYASIPVRRNPKKCRNEFKSLLDTASLLMETGLDKGAGERVNTEFTNKLAGAIVSEPDEYNAKRYEVEVAETAVITIDRLNDNAISQSHEETLADEEGIRTAAKNADIVFSGKELTKAYKKHLIFEEGVEPKEADLRIAAASYSPTIVKTMEKWAADFRASYFDKHAADRDFLKEEYRQRYDELERETAGKRITHLQWPSSFVTSRSLKKYPKHILQQEDGLCPLDLNDFEQFVVETELDRPRTIAFYRNPSNFSPQVFSIPYTAPDGKKALHPDFIFFVRDEDNDIRPAIVDPHGTHLSDVIPKLKGYVEYLREFPDVFKQVLSVGSVSSGEYRSLNLLRSEVQEAIMNFSGDSGEELYISELSNRYGEA